MDGLRLDVDLRPLVGQRVSEVAIGEHELRISFDRGDRVVAEHSLVFRDGVIVRRIGRFADDAGLICRAVGRTIEKARRGADGGMVLRFDGGLELDFEVTSTEFEAFHLTLCGETLVA